MLKTEMFYSSVTYHIYEQKCLYGNNVLKFKEKKTIKCLGGENMVEGKKLVFISPEELPKNMKGKTGRNWSELFDQIPVGQLLVMDEQEYGTGSNIRTQVSKYNKTKKDKVLKMTQRTDKKTEKVTAYVQRLK